MSKTGIFYGTSSGNTEDVAARIKNELGEDAELFDVGSASAQDVMNYNNIIFGASTWGAGDIQDDFETFLDNLQDVDLTGKNIAIFGLGDSASYSDTFANAIGHIYEVVGKYNVVGGVSADDYDYEESISVLNGKFFGLAIDEDNESDKTDERIRNWVSGLKKSFN